jgi:hypothetical protein
MKQYSLNRTLIVNSTYNMILLLNLNRTKVILDNKFNIEGRVVRKIELREYEKKESNISKEYVLKIFLKTENEEIELDYLGKPVSNNKVFNDICNFLSNYNGLTSTINRIFIELDGKLNDKQSQ